MSYITVSRVGELIGITFTSSTTPSDSHVKVMLIESEREVLDLLSEYHHEVRIDDYVPDWIVSPGTKGEANGTNTTFYLPYLPVVDYDGDGSVVDDVTITVYDEDNDTWMENVSITSVDQKRGTVVLTSAPPKNAHVYATYRSFVMGFIPDSKIVSELVFNHVAQKIWRNAKFDLLDEMIESYSLDGININKSKSQVIKEAIKNYKEEFNRLLRLVLKGGGMYYE